MVINKPKPNVIAPARFIKNIMSIKPRSFQKLFFVIFQLSFIACIGPQFVSIIIENERHSLIVSIIPGIINSTRPKPIATIDKNDRAIYFPKIAKLSNFIIS
jgi:hypothetical protein